MDFELRKAREKLDKEQRERERKERAKLKLEGGKQKKRLRINEMPLKLLKDPEGLMPLKLSSSIWKQVYLRDEEYGDKIKLTPSCFTELSNQGAFDKEPLYFQLLLVHQVGSSDAKGGEKENNRTTHSGVLDFTADEGSVAIPPHVYSILFPVDTPKVLLVEGPYVRLPKGTYTKLQHDGIGFSDLPNHKAILETSLRQHAALSQDDVLTVKYGEFLYRLCVLVLKPSSSMSVLETDIEVDIVYPGVESERIDQYVLKPLVFDASESESVEEGNYMYYEFSIDDDTWEKIHPLIFPNRHQHAWSSHDIASKTLILTSKDNNLGTGTYSVAVYGFKGTTKYEVLLHVQENIKFKVGQQAMHSFSLEVDTVECQNCRHFILSRSIALHEAYRSRHNVVCPHAGCGIVLRMDEAKNHVHCNKCGQAFQSGEMEKHMKVFHEPLRCPCGVVLEKEDMIKLNFDLIWRGATLSLGLAPSLDHVGFVET
ncbi:hypothetical protein F3Y22_tig00110462pilonHSYRG00326 [Hibiscus syriacus]|uniref:Uncharacterized protein n=1 Tax=Hibiscus syriacus TaxID=106335 RepID=A0A6A3ALT5_HIBSY|nr:hypothetical protein F3Y22_tig00110462pilonHSYRG00326 [Hibiscus syriacus]